MLDKAKQIVHYISVMGSRLTNSGIRRAATLAAVIATGTVGSASAQDVVPLPSEVFGEQPPGSNPIIDVTDRMTAVTPLSLDPEIPDTITVNNEGGEILYNNENRTLTYKGSGRPIRLVTNEGLDVSASEIVMDLGRRNVQLRGPLTIYQGESLTLADNGTYNWEEQSLDARNVRSKVTGILVRGSRIEYAKDAQGRNFMRVHDAFASTDDAQQPDTWIGTGVLTIYPGDYGHITRLSVSAGDYDIPIPILGWFSFSHSLNPKEGYMPNLGSKSSWGSYLLNSYGFLLGNRRVEGNMPVSDYVLTLHADVRTRRGLAVGFDLEDVLMQKRTATSGLQAYFILDDSPNINPTNTYRYPTDRERYRVALSGIWNLPVEEQNPSTNWTLGTNLNILSDRYVLRDFFEDLSRIDDKPDNTVRVVRRGTLSQTMLMTRFAPNDYYQTDERAELSYYRARTAIRNTGVAYETRNSFGVIRQELSAEERAEYQYRLNNLTDPSARAYYQRMLNSGSYLRANSTHEFSTNFTILRFLNITPKAGVGYSGYYGVDGVGDDHRFLGFAGVDVNIKFHRHYENFRIPSLGMRGLTHVIKPYTTLSHCSISSSNPMVPQVDMWASNFGTSTSNPMELDLMGFTGIDSWGTWNIWRMGVSNVLTTNVDGEQRTLLNWNCFIDYNEENPNSANQFSNLHSLVVFRPSSQFYVSANTMTPTIKNGDGYREYHISMGWQPLAALETSLGYSVLKNHPIQSDAEQVSMRANLRINERYSIACRWNWDIERGRMINQQYSLFRKSGAWYMGATLFFRNNGGRNETGFGLTFTLGETGTSLPLSIM